MPNERISDMPDIVNVANTAVLPIVELGTNWKCSKQEFLTSADGLGVALIAANGGGAFLKSATQPAQIYVLGSSVVMQGALVTIENTNALGLGTFQINGLGAFLWTGHGEMFVSCLAGQCVLRATTVGSSVGWEMSSPGGCIIGYIPANPANWSGFPPNDLAAGLDRCAALLKVLNGGVGP